MVLLNPKWPTTMCRVWLKELEIMQGLSVFIKVHHDTTDHHEI
jgi:hypothetical protein